MYSLSETITHKADWIDMALASSEMGSHGFRSSIRYTVSAVENGVLLSIWEVAAPTTSRPASYLYKLNYRLDSEADAQNVLDWYLSGITDSIGEPLPCR